MKNIYFTPGPSQLYPKINTYLNEAMRGEILSISHRSNKFEKIYQDSIIGLRKLMGIPDNYEIVFLSSAIEAMERIIQNTVFRNSFHILTGDFGNKFYEIALDQNKNAMKFSVDIDTRISEIKIPDDTELICITQNETSNGFSFPINKIKELKNNNPSKLIALDIVSSAPYICLDYKFLDLIFFSVQKGFGMPSGLSILIMSPEALEKAYHLKDRGVNIGSYHNFLNLIKYGRKNQTYETPNVLNIYLLQRILGNMNKIGIEKIRKNIKENSSLLYKFAEEVKIKPYIKINDYRSDTVIVFEFENAEEFIRKIKMKNIILGTGYGDLKNITFRIANFPAHSKVEIEKLIKEMRLLKGVD